jgi:hypothetical protein
MSAKSIELLVQGRTAIANIRRVLTIPRSTRETRSQSA